MFMESMDDVPKHIKRAIRELAARAHEEALRLELRTLHEAFGRWERRELSSLELSDLIHEFHDGPARKLWAAHADRRMADTVVAAAIVDGLIDKSTIPQNVLDHLARYVQLYESQRDSDAE
jgi:hypothetical protein